MRAVLARRPRGLAAGQRRASSAGWTTAVRLLRRERWRGPCARPHMTDIRRQLDHRHAGLRVRACV